MIITELQINDTVEQQLHLVASRQSEMAIYHLHRFYEYAIDGYRLLQYLLGHIQVH